MGRQVMIVDDSRAVAMQIEKLLEGTGFEIAAYCKDGEEAIARYDEVHPDLVTMDLIMPGIDGLEAAEVILQEHPEAKIVMISSLAYDATISEAKSIGIHHFITKPFEKEMLVKIFEQALGDC